MKLYRYGTMSLALRDYVIKLSPDNIVKFFNVFNAVGLDPSVITECDCNGLDFILIQRNGMCSGIKYAKEFYTDPAALLYDMCRDNSSYSPNMNTCRRIAIGDSYSVLCGHVYLDDDCNPMKEEIKQESVSNAHKQIDGSHYENGGVDVIDFCKVNNIPFCEGSVIKYVFRHRKKNKERDILKAIDYLRRIMSSEYNKEINITIDGKDVFAN